MRRMRGWWVGGALILSCGPGVLAQSAPPAHVDGLVPLPHLSRIDGHGAVVQRDVEEHEEVAGEHLAFGDRVTTGDAQVQLVWSDGSLVSLDRRTSLAALSPELLALTAGRVLVVSARDGDGATNLRVDTPAGAVVLAPASEVRVDVDHVGVDVRVVRGSAEVHHPEGAQAVTAGHSLRFRDGLAPGSPRIFNTAAFDSFVEWARAPVVAAQRSPSRSHLDDPRLEAYADVFDRHGQWQLDATWGQVWFPAVGTGWRPFSHGYWQPFAGVYGPTWVGLDPWGWPTHHYGAWDVDGGGRWFWRPGRQWSPGRVTWSVGPGYVGWSPLGVRGDVPWAWNRLSEPPRATQRGVYPAGTLDPYRAWTVIPTERFGVRGGLSPYAVDARSLTNLDAFVTQGVAPPLRYGAAGAYGPGAGWHGGYPGRAHDRVGYGSWTGDDTTSDLRRGIPPTRVAPPEPGPYGGPSPDAVRDDPYGRARGMMVPRGQQRMPPAADTPQTTSAPRGARPRAAAPPERAPQRRRPPPPEEATPAPARAAPPARGVESPRRAPGSAPERRAVPRPPA